MNNRQHRTDWVRAEAERLGFSFVGFARAERLEQPARRLEAWLNQGAHGRMAWMENYFDLRIDPTKLVPGAKTVICFAFNYFNPDAQNDPDAPRISRYAYGEDYHFVVKRHLKTLLQAMQAQFGDFTGRCFVDSAPVMEREWAERAGLGWNGRHTLTIHPQQGSFFFLAEIICDLDMVYDDPIRDHCGTCRRCIDACPTNAISDSGYWLHADRCISYLTIELRDEIPVEFQGKMENRMFGCDICQDVCPWNRFAKRHQKPAFAPHPDLLHLTRRDWEDITEEVFGRVFKKSAVKRIKYEGLKKNIRFLKK
ncbi:MAG: tRNA epoxyqueuosine(34) reductase QueG [Saprospiraceae bacterium]|nr:tRNA epoxyqueuosine(34) reductase QueG [Saprospiraceae bacterium]